MTFIPSFFDPVQCKREVGSFSQSGFNLELCSDQICTFMHTQQTEMSARGKFSGTGWDLKAHPVIRHFKFDLVGKDVKYVTILYFNASTAISGK